MNPLQTARLSGLLDHRRIDQAQGSMRGCFGRNTSFLKQRTAKPLQPILALAQPFEQSYVGKFCKFGVAGSHYRLSHRKTASEVQQKRTKVVFFGLILAQAFQRFRRLRELFPVWREKG